VTAKGSEQRRHFEFGKLNVCLGSILLKKSDFQIA